MALIATALATAGLIVVSVLAVPGLPALPQALQEVSDDADVAIEKLGGLPDAVAPPVQPAAVPSLSAPAMAAQAAEPPVAAKALGSSGFLNAAFVLQDNPQSVASLRAHLANLQIVFPDWLSFGDARGALAVNVDRKLAGELHAAGVKVLARVTNINAEGAWFEDGLGAFLRNARSAALFRDHLLTALTDAGADGVNIDIETLHPEDESAYVDWLKQLTDTLHARGFQVTVDLPMSNKAYDYEAIGRLADAVVLMAYDEHWSTSGPGPIASRPWFEKGLDQATQRIPADKLIAGIGAYSFDWTQGATTAESLSFDEAVALAAQHQARIDAGGEDVNSHFTTPWTRTAGPTTCGCSMRSRGGTST